MGALLDRAFAENSRLPKRERDGIARRLLRESASERRWAEAFDGSCDAVDRLAGEALEGHRRGRSKPLDPERP